jgi:methyltransferase
VRRHGLDRAYPALLALVGSQRLAELLISRRNEHRSGRELGTAGRRSYPLMVALHVLLFVLPLVERRRRVAPPLPLIAPAWFAVGMATALRLWVITTLGQGWNVRGRVPAGLQVVDRGPYRFIRHPNYVAIALEMASLPLAGGAYQSALALSVANAAVLLPRIAAEERLLDRVPGYAQRMGGKPRFIPRRILRALMLRS